MTCFTPPAGIGAHATWLPGPTWVWNRPIVAPLNEFAKSAVNTALYGRAGIRNTASGAAGRAPQPTRLPTELLVPAVLPRKRRVAPKRSTIWGLAAVGGWGSVPSEFCSQT